MTINLQYASPRLRRSRPIFYRMSIACGLIPLVVGVGIFILWLIVGGTDLMIGGLMFIPVGCLFFVMGMGNLIAYTWIESRIRGGFGPHLRKQAGLALCLLLVNFPVAYGCIVAGTTLPEKITVVVKNKSSAPIDSFVITTAAGARELGPIAPGDAVRLRVERSTTRYSAIDYVMVHAGKKSLAFISLQSGHDPGPEAHYIVVSDGAVTDTCHERLW